MLPYTMHDRHKGLLLRVVLGTMVGPSITTTVTGVSPLSLLNALAGTLLSLEQTGKCVFGSKRYTDSIIQEGKCVQNGTPTPSNPIDIKCNNGSLKMVDDELPIGYKRITGIKFDGDFWYETGEALTGDDDVTMTLANTVTSGQNVFGSFNGTSGGAKNFSLYIFGGGSTSNSYFRYGEQLLRPKFGGNERTITFGKSGTSGFTTDVAATPETFTTVATAYIGMLPNSSSPAYTGSIIGSITVGTRLKWIPCERESDGVIGYYEAVNGVFLEPIGEGTPVAGSYDTTHLTVLSVEGTPEVLAVSGTNIFDKADGSSWGGYYVATNDKIAVSDSNLTVVIRCLPNTTYYGIHKSGRGGGRMFTVSTEEWAVGDIANEMQGTASIAADTVFSYTTQADAKWLFVCFGRSTSGMPSFEEQAADFMLSLTQLSAASEYADYSGLPQTASVQNLFAVGDYKDEQDIISGLLTHRVGIKVLDGTETWTTDTYGGYRHMVLQEVLNASDDMLPVLCSHYVSRAADARQQPNSIFIASSGKLVIYVDSTQNISTSIEFNTWLASEYANGTPVILIYPLATETSESVIPQLSHDGSYVAATAVGEVDDIPVTLTNTLHTTPAPEFPIDILCNNGPLKKIANSTAIGAGDNPEVITITPSGDTAHAEDLLAIGSYTDMQDIISGDISRNVKPLALTGQEEWTLVQDGSNDIFRLVLVDSASDSKYTLGVMCTYYETVPQLSVADQTLTGSGQNYDFVDSRFNTVEQWKTWLATQYSADVPVILLYPLASQISASVTAQSLSLEEGTNTITVTAVVPDISLTAKYKIPNS